MTPEQYAIVTEIIPEDGILSYTADEADPVKNYFQTETLSHDFGRYLHTYIELAIQNPQEYLQAWLDLIKPYWSIESIEYIRLSYSYTFPDLNHWNISRASHFSWYYYYLTGYIDSMGADCRFYNLPAGCLWLLAMLLGLSIAKSNQNLFLCILPLVLYLATMLLGPVALLRYLYPLMMTTPMLFGAIFQKNIEEEKRRLS